ncbi:MAG: hypothetical protein KF894_08835 [Labilithrix sp.]|nr:hypothetical protein [Labilithrix sp.]
MALPLIGALAGQLGKGLGPALGYFTGVGKVKRQAGGFYDPTGERQTGYDANASNWAGYKGGLRDYSANLASERNRVENRAAFQADYGQAHDDRARGLEARSGAVSMADMIAARARGETPSIAQMQADRQMGQAVASQNAQAASARGNAGRALAAQNAAGNIAGAQSSISNSAQINAAQERERAEANAVGAYQGIRQGDQSAEGLAGQRSQFNTQMQQHNRDANDSRAMGYEQLDSQAQQAQLGAKMQQQGQLAGSHANAEGQNAQNARQNASTDKDWFGKMFPSDANAKLPILSDIAGKTGLGLGGPSPMSGPAPSSFDKLNPDGSMDVEGSLKAHSDFATQFQADPTGGMGGGGMFGMLSDGKAKVAPRKVPMDWEENDRQDARERKLRDPKSFHRLSDGEVKKARAQAKRVSEDQAAKDADAMMAGWKASLEGGSFLSDTNAKKSALIQQGRREGAQQMLSRGPEGLGLGNPNAPKMQFSPAGGWQFPRDEEDDVRRAQLDRAMASQVEQDRADIEIDRGLEEQSDAAARRSSDPAVGLGRAPKGYAQRRAAELGESDDAAPETPAAQKSKYDGLAPGTEDFDRTAPKPAAKTPWWMTPVPTDLLGFESDERAKLAARQEGFRDGEKYSEEMLVGKKTSGKPKYMWPEWAKNYKPPPSSPAPRKPTPGADAELPPVTADIGARPFERGRPSNVAPQGLPKDREAIADANRSMAGAPYMYKPGLTPPSQKPGEPNYGPMAQNMEQSPVAATAVKQDPTTGLRVIDRDKALKVTMAGNAANQMQIDELRAELERKKKGGKR